MIFVYGHATNTTPKSVGTTVGALWVQISVSKRKKVLKKSLLKNQKLL
jgi:hypothetical protein